MCVLFVQERQEHRVFNASTSLALSTRRPSPVMRFCLVQPGSVPPQERSLRRTSHSRASPSRARGAGPMFEGTWLGPRRTRGDAGLHRRSSRFCCPRVVADSHRWASWKSVTSSTRSHITRPSPELPITELRGVRNLIPGLRVLPHGAAGERDDGAEHRGTLICRIADGGERVGCEANVRLAGRHTAGRPLRERVGERVPCSRAPGSALGVP